MKKAINRKSILDYIVVLVQLVDEMSMYAKLTPANEKSTNIRP